MDRSLTILRNNGIKTYEICEIYNGKLLTKNKKIIIKKTNILLDIKMEWQKLEINT